MFLEQLFLWLAGAVALYVVVKLGWSLLKKMVVPRQHLKASQQRKRIAEEELEAARLEAEALAMEKEAERVVGAAFDAQLEGKSDVGSTPRRQ
jgi:membrane protein insertase Oxa1/YidC/SpoIIIJ